MKIKSLKTPSRLCALWLRSFRRPLKGRVGQNIEVGVDTLLIAGFVLIMLTYDNVFAAFRL